MMPKGLIIFDLDGTVNDSSPGILYCYRKTGETYGINDLSDDFLRTALTGPFEINISKVLGLKEDQIMEAVKRYIVFYTAEGRFMCELFDGMAETLDQLRSRGYTIGMATMMVDEYAKDTLKRYGILDRFDTIHGASLEVTYCKEDLVRMCLEDTSMSPEESILVGDGPDDHRAAKESGVGFIAAKYGYGIDDEYCRQHSVRGIDRPLDLIGILDSSDDPES